MNQAFYRPTWTAPMKSPSYDLLGIQASAVEMVEDALIAGAEVAGFTTEDGAVLREIAI